MKTQHDHHDLVTEVIRDVAGETFRQETLTDGLAALRRTRRQRAVSRYAAVGAALIAIVAAVVWRERASHLPIPSSPPHPVIAGTSIRVLNDQELFAFFQGRPAALYGEPGNQRFVLLDEPEPRVH